VNLKTKIRAGKIRPKHNVTVHGTAASSFSTGRIAAQAAETAEVVTLAASTSGSRNSAGGYPCADAAHEAQGFGHRLSQHPGEQNFMRFCEERRLL
jgi:hypothetical protein